MATAGRTLAQLAQKAVDVQDACNLSGVAAAFAEVMLDLRRLGLGTDEANHHPVARAFIDKMSSLAGIQVGMADYNADVYPAHEACERLAKEGV